MWERIYKYIQEVYERKSTTPSFMLRSQQIMLQTEKLRNAIKHVMQCDRGQKQKNQLKKVETLSVGCYYCRVNVRGWEAEKCCF